MHKLKKPGSKAKSITKTMLLNDTAKKKMEKTFRVQKKVEKVVAEDVDIVPSKKMSKRLKTQLATIGQVTPREATRAIKATFGESAEKINALLEMNDNDGALVLLQKRMLQSSVSMLIYAEKALVSSEGAKGTYQYATLISQIRELITDIQAAKDRKFIADALIVNAVQPCFMNIAEMMINQHQGFRKEVGKDERDLIRDSGQQEFNAALRDLAKDLARKIHAEYNVLEVKIREQLNQ